MKNNNYKEELSFIAEQMRYVNEHFLKKAPVEKKQKSEFDIVTDIDCSIETYLADAIRTEFPGDQVMGEEWSSDQEIIGRTWTIDPIDGTCNFAQTIPLFGIQCSLIDDGDVVLGAIYLPASDELFTSVKGQGLCINGKAAGQVHEVSLNNAIVSFGDYSHTRTSLAELQHNMIKQLYPQVAKIRMFGAACMDFSMAAAGRSSGTVVMTRNLWDLLPGVIMCREAGLQVTNLEGEPYKIGDYGVIAAGENVLAAIREAMNGL